MTIRWLPIHIHMLPDGLRESDIIGAIIPIEINPAVQKRYWGRYIPFSVPEEEKALNFLEQWPWLCKKSVFAKIDNIGFSIEGYLHTFTPSMIHRMKELGLLSVQIYHWNTNPCFDSVRGLTERGKRLLKCIEQHDLFLDLSHLQGPSLNIIRSSFKGRTVLSHVVCEDMLDWEVTRRANAMSEHELLLANAEIYGIPFVDDMVSPKGVFLPHERKVSIKNVAYQIDRLAQIVGVEKTALGPDFFDYTIIEKLFGCKVMTVHGLEEVTGLQILKDMLIKMGWRSDDIDRVFFKNAIELFFPNFKYN